MKVKIYGSSTFTPSDLPAGVTLQRGTISHNLGGTVSDYASAWTASAEWADGWYCRSSFPNDTFGLCPAAVQDSSPTSGWEYFQNSKAKQLLARVGSDLPSGAIISYVRVWLSVYASNKAQFSLKHFYRVVGGGSVLPGPSGTWGVEGGANSTYFNSSYLALPQRSGKLTNSPVPGNAFTKDVLYNTGWGVVSTPGAVGNGAWAQLGEMAIEVGYDDTPYEVITGGAFSSATSVILHGSVNPQGDVSGNWFFQYGLNPFVGTSASPTVAPATSLYNVTFTINSLSPDTLYYYRLVATSSAGDLTYGATRSFSTVSMCSTRPLMVL